MKRRKEGGGTEERDEHIPPGSLREESKTMSSKVVTCKIQQFS